MNYFEVITANKTWVCPKSGIWKIIAVGGGSSGIVAFTANNAIGSWKFAIENGGTSTFGTLLTASGGVNEYSSTFAGGGVNCGIGSGNNAGGPGGYTLDKYGGEGAKYLYNSNGSSYSSGTGNGGPLGQSGYGYGAGGFAGITNNWIYFTNSAGAKDQTYPSATVGFSGKLNELITDLISGSSHNCIIGSGGKLTLQLCRDMVSSAAALAGGSVTAENSTSNDSIFNKAVGASTPGRSGCIVLQYIGASY